MLEALKPIVVLLHVIAAFAYVTGYVSTNVLTELARRTNDPAFRREALRFSTHFDQLLIIRGGVLVAITGIAFSMSCAARATWRSADSRTSHYSRSSS